MTMNRDLLMSILAMDSYNRSYGANLDIATTGIGTATENTFSLPTGAEAVGFYASSYNWNGETIISYRGTNFQVDHWYSFFSSPLWQDIGNGWGTGVGSNFEPQAKMAFEYYNTVAAHMSASDPRMANITTTGHSLGSGLAGLVSSIYNRSGVLFDNMPFEAAAANTYGAVSTGLPSLVWPNRSSDIYRGLAPWAPNISGLKTIFTPGEILEGLRFLQSTPDHSYQSHTDLDAVALHSIGLLVSLMWADQNNKAEWFKAGNAIGHAFVNADIGEALGRAQGGTGAADPASQLLMAIAYSAISDGERPFGDTAIISMFDDATDLSKALDRVEVSATLRDSADQLAEALVQFAGKLALGDVEGGASSSVASGMLDLSTDGLTLAANFSANRWGNGLAHTTIVGRDELVKKALSTVTGADGAASDLATGMKWLWNTTNTDIINRVEFATTDTATTRALPTSGNVGSNLTIFVDGSGSDTTTGSADDEIIVGGGGVDTIRGGAGDDLIAGGIGDDVLSGGAGKDFIAGGAGVDTLDIGSDSLASGAMVILKAVDAASTGERATFEITENPHKKAGDMTAPATVAMPNITLDRRAPSRHDSTQLGLADGFGRRPRTNDRMAQHPKPPVGPVCRHAAPSRCGRTRQMDFRVHGGADLPPRHPGSVGAATLDLSPSTARRSEPTRRLLVPSRQRTA
ncbi:hypothetical protein SPAN111604_15005 [Sphingomonas antarctica]|uniref:calcium-binding protein n=1 Tax=Sphingomonas antarctica TaxID=2040274 RepID=UPI0039EC77A0